MSGDEDLFCSTTIWSVEAMETIPPDERTMIETHTTNMPDDKNINVCESQTMSIHQVLHCLIHRARTIFLINVILKAWSKDILREQTNQNGKFNILQKTSEHR